MSAAVSQKIPGDIILEPNERVLVATHPLFLWEPIVLIWLVLGTLGLYGFGLRDTVIAGIGLVTFLVVGLLLFITWIPWRARWFVLTDRRVIARWGVLNRNQAALLLERIQDASLMRPFPLSLVRDYGEIHVESAGELSDEKISAGLRDLRMVGASRFYRTLTDVLTPGR
ncbi:MAG: PH domain-containing protein [Chloroflexi bacterium]|nr:PH domain-containing protein [Chloroflexota bacterium]